MARCAEEELMPSTNTKFLGCGAIAIAALSLWARPVQAGIGACGNIHVEADAKCEVVAPGVKCTAQCKPLAVRAACSVKLATGCTGGCDKLPSAECTGSCGADCQAECTKLEPGKFDCQGTCDADCSGRCGAECEGNKDTAGCEANCQGSCSASCQGSCDVDLPKADCDAGCEASCDGSCKVDPNLDCQLSCQSEGQADCEAELQGGCEASCKGEEGALFCDGQYVDHGDNLKACADALKAALNIDVSGDVSGMAGCSGGKGCAAEGRASAKLASNCAVATPGTRSRGGALVWLAACGAIVSLVRKRRH